MDAAPVPRASDGSPQPRRDSPTFRRDVQAMFTHIAGQYSLFDHLATFGQDLLWRPRALWEVDRRRAQPPRRVLDVGCGPGDLSFLLAHHYPEARLLALDLTEAMVRRGERGRGARPEGSRVTFATADALRLPVRTGSVDLVTSAFLVRNLPDLGEGLAEMRRVLAPGGTLLALEITEPIPDWFRPLFHAYFDRVVPKMGALFGTEGPYRYLSESLKSFPSRDRVVDLLRSVGFQDAQACPQSQGIVTGFFAQVASDRPTVKRYYPDGGSPGPTCPPRPRPSTPSATPTTGSPRSSG